MGAGGHRDGAGRKSEWRHPTERIRLPALYHEQLREIAHKLDMGEVLVFGTESELDAAIAGVLGTIPPRDRASAARLFKKLKKQLQG